MAGNGKVIEVDHAKLLAQGVLSLDGGDDKDAELHPNVPSGETFPPVSEPTVSEEESLVQTPVKAERPPTTKKKSKKKKPKKAADDFSAYRVKIVQTTPSTNTLSKVLGKVSKAFQTPAGISFVFFLWIYLRKG